MAVNRYDAETIFSTLNALYPDAHCELNYSTHFELLCAVMLSAQTTDVSVNRVTSQLFEQFPNADVFSKADVEEVKSLIRSIGLYKNKAANLIAMSQKLVEKFDGQVPSTMEELTSLDGVGRKTANVVMSELFNVDTIAVDTHVSRVAQRLKIAKIGDDVNVIEKKLKNFFPKERWRKVHHLFIFFGRYFCLARNPKCEHCPFVQKCRKDFR